MKESDFLVIKEMIKRSSTFNPKLYNESETSSNSESIVSENMDNSQNSNSSSQSVNKFTANNDSKFKNTTIKQMTN